MPASSEVKALHNDLVNWVQNGMGVRPSSLRPELNDWYALIIEIIKKPADELGFDKLQKLESYSVFFTDGASSPGISSGAASAYKSMSPRIKRCLDNHPDYRAYKIMQEFYDAYVPKLRTVMSYLREFEHGFPKVAHYIKRAEAFIEAIEQMDPNLAVHWAHQRQQYAGVPAYLLAQQSAPPFSPTVSQIFEGAKKPPLNSVNILVNIQDICRKLYAGLEADAPDNAPSVRHPPEKSWAELYHDCDQAKNAWTAILDKLPLIEQSRSGRLRI